MQSDGFSIGFQKSKSVPVALLMVFLLDSKGANVCKSSRYCQELSNKYLVFTCKHRLRSSREWASQSLSKTSQKLEKKLEQTKAAVLDGKLYVTSGSSSDVDIVPQGGGTTLTSVWRYDPSTNAWEEVASMTAGRHGFLLCSF